MLSGIFDQPNYSATKQMLEATMLRQEAIARNLANVETPNYKRLDVDPSFSSALTTALKTGNSRNISQLEPALSQDRTAAGANSSGNNVELEKEMLALHQNSLAHSVQTHLINGNFLKLRLAITGRPG